jgi:hypothetical protein
LPASEGVFDHAGMRIELDTPDIRVRLASDAKRGRRGAGMAGQAYASGPEAAVQAGAPGDVCLDRRGAGDARLFQPVAKDSDRPITLAEVPPVLFSELMRDADFFVSVAGLGNDAGYGTRGNAAHGTYWTQAAFGPLTETAKTRHAVLMDTLAGLSIADRCRLEEHVLVVAGKLRTYRIHLGSANIRMEPNDQYLCIMPAYQSVRNRVHLPFEGDNTLSVIISKAFLLADDDKITDPTMLSQIEYR